MANFFTLEGQEYAMEICCNCGVKHAFPRELYDIAQDKKTNGISRSFYCPNGHSWHYTGESEADKQRRRAERAEQERARLQDELRLAENRERRLKKRAAAGTCPCCQRTFANMSRHMKTKHPEFAADNVVKLKGKVA